MSSRTKRLLVALAVIVLVIATAFTIWQPWNSQTYDTETPTPAPSSPPATPDTADEEAADNPGGSYVSYSEEAFNAADGRRLLFFHAQWCPQCRALEADIKDSAVPNDVTIFEVDYDTATDLKQKYGVTLQTTVVEVGESGNEIDKVVAYDDPTLDFVLRELME